ncbi:hypothetical protein R0H03_10805 [Pediococcus acidilactici]|uniref:DNA replication protein n=1 Tax=Pediococcus acidilactici TaxID=1254 RepID=A0AAW8YS31_PEDAC|nr:hypothetical protein [Pediococcus acidilactici]MDV2912316.1 hypothetical protein [Pediococcus acidilactici]WQS17275.1 hypothetical protein SGW14_09690 [Pediococcus acidilactici]WQS18346.1 hypothetical protein SGW14_04740 [Pediococcus acidilactici]
MAQRRMFSKKITDTDTFLDMPLSSQALYFHLNMHADDDGFVSNAKTIKRMIGSSDDDLKLLLAKQFIFAFESGVVVIKDWKIHNYIRKDTYNTTIYGDEKEQLEQDENGAYTLRPRAVDDPSPQVRLGKDRLGKDINNSSSDDEQPDFEQEFEMVWKEYPNKTGKKQAFNHYKAWRRKSVNNTNEYLLNRLALYKQDLAINTWKRPMNGSTWFNGRFDDEYQTQQQTNAQKGSSYGGVEF